MEIVRSPSELPEFVAALHDEWLQRTMAFHTLPERIGGFVVLPMTLRHYSMLRLAGSPFLPPFETPTEDEIAQFLWCLSPEFSGDMTDKFAKRCRQFCDPSPSRLFQKRYLSRMTSALELRVRLVKQLRDFVEITMMDRPAQVVTDGIDEPSFYCDECSLVASLARNYGWSEGEILNMPLRRVFQYLKEIRHHHAAKNGVPHLLCNRSEMIADKYLEAINRRN